MNKAQNKSKNTKKEQRVKRRVQKKLSKSITNELKQRHRERVYRSELVQLGFTIGTEDKFIFTYKGKRAHCQYCNTRLDILNIAFKTLPSSRRVFVHNNTACLEQAEVEAKLAYKKDKVMKSTYHILQ